MLYSSKSSLRHGRVIFLVSPKFSPRPKRPDAVFVEAANQLLHSSVDDEEVVEHLGVGGASKAALRTPFFALEAAKMMQEMEAEVVLRLRVGW